MCEDVCTCVFMRMCACTLCVCKDVRTFVCCVKMCVSASCVCVHASKSVYEDVFAPYVGVRMCAPACCVGVRMCLPACCVGVRMYMPACCVGVRMHVPACCVSVRMCAFMWG